MMMSAIKRAEGEMWCILRTSPARTLPLTHSLAQAGFDVFTPTVIVSKRKPRRPGIVKQPAAMMPTYVFARAEHQADLTGLCRSPASSHPAFSLFRFDGGVVKVTDREVETLRAAERGSMPKRQRRTIAAGSGVRPTEGPYAGMTGIVKESDGKFTLVAFGQWMDVKIDTSSIPENELVSVHPTGVAA